MDTATKYRRFLWALIPVLLVYFASAHADVLAAMMLYARSGFLPSESIVQTLPTTNSTSPTDRTQPTEQQKAPEAVISFSKEDISLIRLRNSTEYDPDLEKLLLQPLRWDLTGAEPTVLIIHTHTTESYTGDYTSVESYRSLDAQRNMIAIGDEVARVLEMGGITVVHARTIHDYPDYNGSYAAARQTIQQYLEQYPSIVLVLDLHRDAASGDAGQLVTAATVGGQKSAQLMLVMGSHTATASHKNWEENLALGLKLSVVLEQEYPGITRPMLLRAKRYNLDLSTGSLLVEVGAAGNTLEEALIAANALAQGILTLKNGY